MSRLPDFPVTPRSNQKLIFDEFSKNSNSREIERRLMRSMRNCKKKVSRMVPRPKTLKKGMFLMIFKIVKNRIFDLNGASGRAAPTPLPRIWLGGWAKNQIFDKNPKFSKSSKLDFLTKISKNYFFNRPPPQNMVGWVGQESNF